MSRKVSRFADLFAQMSAIQKEIEGLGKEVSNFNALIPGDLEKVDIEQFNADVDSSTEDAETTFYPSMFPDHFDSLPNEPSGSSALDYPYSESYTTSSGYYTAFYDYSTANPTITISMCHFPQSTQVLALLDPLDHRLRECELAKSDEYDNCTWTWGECQAQEPSTLCTNLMPTHIIPWWILRLLLKVKEFLLKLLIAILVALRSLAKGYGLGTLCSEYAHRRRPPCTTMPWNIWPALVVLWGVCWMFYGSPQITDSTWMDMGLGKPLVL
jgi:hypothetical protein